MGAFKWIGISLLIVIIAVITYPIASIYNQLQEGQQWGLIMNHNVSSQPKSIHSRFRYHNDGYDKYPNVFFFQVDAPSSLLCLLTFHMTHMVWMTCFNSGGII
jgi:hypothetical protein